MIGFLVCGTDLRVFKCERSGVFSSQPVRFGQGSGALVICIIAGLVLPRAKLGFFGHLPNPQHVPINESSTLVVSIIGERFELRDHLAGQSICVQLAWRISQNSWSHCFKILWPYKAREHESNILEKFKGISGTEKV